MSVYMYIYTYINTLPGYSCTSSDLTRGILLGSDMDSTVVPDIQNLIRLKNIPVYELWRTF